MCRLFIVTIVEQSHIVLRIWWGNWVPRRVEDEEWKMRRGGRQMKRNWRDGIEVNWSFELIHSNGLYLEQMFISRVLKLFVLVVRIMKVYLEFILSVEYFFLLSVRCVCMEIQDTQKQTNNNWEFSRLFNRRL